MSYQKPLLEEFRTTFAIGEFHLLREIFILKRNKFIQKIIFSIGKTVFLKLIVYFLPE